MESKEQNLNLCDEILPGQTYIFAVIAEKSKQISSPTTISYTVRPLPPKELTVEANFEMAKFRVFVKLPSAKESKADKCQIIITSEQRLEQIVKVNEEDKINRYFIFLAFV